MTPQTDIALGFLRQFLQSIEGMTAEERRALASELHRIVILVDDQLCDRFDFSRRARGKYLSGEKR